MRKVRDSFKFNLIVGATLVGKYGIPYLPASYEIPNEVIPFDKALAEPNKTNKFVHFYINDFQFDRIWNKPNKYLKVLQQFAGVISPDFSMFLNVPNAHNIYAHYKKQALSHFYASNGIKVIPSFGTSGRTSYEWCFDGLPTNSVIAVCTVGVEKEIFIDSMKELDKRLQPAAILVYGKVFEEMNEIFKERIVKYESRVEQLQKLKKEV